MHDRRRFRRTAAVAAVALLLSVAGSVAQAEVQPGRVAENTKFGNVHDPLRGRDIRGWRQIRRSAPRRDDRRGLSGRPVRLPHQLRRRQDVA